MGMIGVPELLVIGGIVVLLFGAKKIPELASGLGKGLKEFRKATNEVNKENELADEKKENVKVESKS